MRILLILGLLFIPTLLYSATLKERVVTKTLVVDKAQSDTKQKEAVSVIVDEETTKEAQDLVDLIAPNVDLIKPNKVKFLHYVTYTEDAVVTSFASLVNGKVKVVPLIEKRLKAKFEER